MSADGRKKLNDDTASAIISDRKVIRKKTKARMERKNFVSKNLLGKAPSADVIAENCNEFVRKIK